MSSSEVPEGEEVDRMFIRRLFPEGLPARPEEGLEWWEANKNEVALSVALNRLRRRINGLDKGIMALSRRVRELENREVSGSAELSACAQRVAVLERRVSELEREGVRG